MRLFNEMTEFLVNKKCNVNIRNKENWNVLHVACRYKDNAEIYELVHAGADIKAQNDIGFTHLHIVCKYRGLKELNLLLTLKAKLLITDKYERKPVDLVFENETFEIESQRETMTLILNESMKINLSSGIEK